MRGAFGVPWPRREPSLTIVVYDVSSDAKRTKLHALLKEYGVPIQLSAFEARVSEAERRRMIERAGRLIDPETDRLVVYVVPHHRENAIIELGQPRPRVKMERYFIV